MRSTLIHDKVIKWAKAKVFVYSGSVLCLGKMHDHSEANAKWRDQLEDLRQSNAYRDSYGIGGEPIEFERNISQDLQRWRFFKRPKRIWTFDKQIQNNLREESSSCRCSTMLTEQRKEILQNVFRIPRRSRTTQKSFRVDIDHSSAQEKKTHGMERTLINLKDSGILLLVSKWKISKKVDIRYSERYQSVESRSPETARWKMYDSLFLRNLRIQSSYFARFTQQISSVFTRQCELVSRCGFTDSRSNTHDHGKIGREGKLPVI